MSKRFLFFSLAAAVLIIVLYGALALRPHDDPDRTAFLDERARLRLERKDADIRALKKSRIPDAEIVGAPSDPGIRARFLNRGSASGVALGSAVTSPGGVFIGKITAVQTDGSTVTLLTDLESRTAVSLEGGAHTSGLLTGSPGGGLNISFIPREEKLERGMKVVSSGLERDIPRGLLIGRIDEFSNDERDPFQSARVAPAAIVDDSLIVGIVQL